MKIVAGYEGIQRAYEQSLPKDAAECDMVVPTEFEDSDFQTPDYLLFKANGDDYADYLKRHPEEEVSSPPWCCDACERLDNELAKIAADQKKAKKDRPALSMTGKEPGSLKIADMARRLNMSVGKALLIAKNEPGVLKLPSAKKTMYRIPLYVFERIERRAANPA